jgi:poly-D-alanine transfer protein DltD
MKKTYTHLYGFIAALVVFMGALIGYDLYSQSVEGTYIHALAAISPTLVSESLSGSALQRIALRQPDLLPVYGASELNSEGSSNNRAVVFLSKYPTGFEIYEVAKGGATSLDVAQALAALGPELQGKKVVVSFTTNQFGSSEVGNDAYAGDYSALHANELAFSPFLSMDLKHRAAQRMLDYPDTLKDDPLLTLALQWLSARSFGSDLLYQGLLPLGQLRTEAIRLQDHWQVLNYIWSHPTLNPAVTRQAAKIDWGALTVKAQTDQIIASSNDPYGVENTIWSNRYATFKPKTPGSGD